MILATVNGEPITAAFAVARSMLHHEEFVSNSINLLLIRQYANKKGIHVSNEELQLAADEMRYQNGLESVEKLQAWLHRRGLTVLTIQNAIEGMLIRNKLRASIADSDIEAYYVDHRLDFETVELFSLRVEQLALAEELATQIREEGADFHQLARRHSTDEGTRHLGGWIGELRRADVTPEIEAAVFSAEVSVQASAEVGAEVGAEASAEVGAVVGPIETAKGHNLFKVHSRQIPSLEDQREKIRFDLFQDLLARLRREASVEMNILAGLP